MKSLVAAIGIWLVFVLVFVSLVGAQSGRAPAPGSKAPAIGGLVIPVTVKASDPKVGAVEASVEDEGGRVTALPDQRRG